MNKLKKLFKSIQVFWRLGPERIIELQTREIELEKENKEFYEKMMHDKLTGLFNWRFFEEVLKVEIERTVRQEEPLSVVFFDLDNFKIINDAFGHQRGNEILQEVGKVFRKTDFACRWGGDEFIIVIPRVTKEDVEERIIRRIISELESKDIHLSYTILFWENEKHSSMEEFMGELDALLYQNKRQKQKGPMSIKA